MGKNEREMKKKMEKQNAETELISASAGDEDALARTSVALKSGKGFLVDATHSMKLYNLVSLLGKAYLQSFLLPVVKDSTKSERVRKWAIDLLVYSHLNSDGYPTQQVDLSLRDTFFEMSESDEFIKQELDNREQLKSIWFVAIERIAFVGSFLLLAALSALFGWEAKWGKSTQMPILGFIQTSLLAVPALYLVGIVGGNSLFRGYYNPFIDRSIERQPPSFSLKRLVTSSYIILSIIALIIAVWIGAAIIGVFLHAFR